MGDIKKYKSYAYGGGTKFYNVKDILNKETKIFEDPELNKLIIKSLHNEEESIINSIILINKDFFCYEDSVWYNFNNNIWCKCDNADKHIINKYTKKLTQVIEYIKEHTLNAVIKSEYLEQIEHFISKFEKQKKRNELIDMVQVPLTRNERLDEKFNLFGFSNGVYDFNNMTFRERTHTDMVSKSCGYSYCDGYKDKNKMDKLISHIFPIEESKDIFLSCVAAALCGKPQNFLITISCDNESPKILLINLLSRLFGTYLCKINALSDIVANDKKIPKNLSTLKTTRIVIINNTKKISHYDISRLANTKLLDHHYEKKIETFDVKFLTICMCTKDPILDEKHEDYVARLPITNAFKKDFDFDFSSNDLFLLLLEYLKKCKETNFLVDKFIFEYSGLSDDEKLCRIFVRECLERKPNHRVKSNDIYKKFLNWKITKNHNEKFTDKKFFKLIRTLDNLNISKNLKVDGINSSGFDGLMIKEWCKTMRNIESINYTDSIKINDNTYTEYEEIKIGGINVDKKQNKNKIIKNSCIGIDNICPVGNKSREGYDGYCTICFSHFFPNDPRTKNIRLKSKEIAVVNHVCQNHDGEWYNDVPLRVNFEDECCPSRRRIDLYRMIEGTLLCIEVDENQHKYYTKQDDFKRYNEIFLDMSCKYIFIRYNPDKYKKNGIETETDIKTRLKSLSDEINKQINRIENNENTDLLEIIHMFYDE
jgi:hypothetical protein